MLATRETAARTDAQRKKLPMPEASAGEDDQQVRNTMASLVRQDNRKDSHVKTFRSFLLLLLLLLSSFLASFARALVSFLLFVVSF